MENLIPLPIGDLSGKKFFIPHYQRGYRWTKLQVQQLLEDIDSFRPEGQNRKTFYCLQPVVIKLLDADTKGRYELDGDWYEVVDGQQRLTTIYLILRYIKERWSKEDSNVSFELFYETRTQCVNFLHNIRVNTNNDVDIDKGNIDFYYISSAYQAIRSWEADKTNLDRDSFESKFLRQSKVIWYHVASHVNSQELFERLNLGKIPLTNAELTKALFLSSESFKGTAREEAKIKQIEIAILWDEIEHRLNEPDNKFWSFITNKNRAAYETKIELILDLISEKKDDEKDPLFTFLFLIKKQQATGTLALWKKIEDFYYTVSEWYLDKDYYHKIGYLVAARKIPGYSGIQLNHLVMAAMETPKNAFHEKINAYISASVKVDLLELRYETHYNEIFNILLLFNVETNRKTDAEFYPFKWHKDNSWSIEHIHARNSENFDRNKKDPWMKWLDLHQQLLKEKFQDKMDKDVQELLDQISKWNHTDDLTWVRFDDLFKRVNDLLTLDPESMDKGCEGIGNLALLCQEDNASLSNGVFEIKRRAIIELDKDGSFIPVCTRRVFMKYYNDKGINTDYFYWSELDRTAYIDALTGMLKDYLPKTHMKENAN
ncbi:DUF262 domain-containing protein [Chitinophaga silvisoli]|uniref:DUF262 domain-containing protein n=1 Tax=Chitinophaga silvisoli TaxID=2291814 RepID=A0A3E1P8K5_9BACT|nr:DUF262 domain-containing protein [Chitinophaga silvisoli]RFM36513.1 DUF262 domain-containing protein [Chitinophaga silvisoli]